MPESRRVRDRLHVWREVAWSRWKATVITLYGAVCFLEFARDHWASDALKAKLHFVPNLTWQGWTIGALTLLVIATLEGAYRAVQSREKSLHSERQATLARTNATDDTGQGEFILLAGQLRHFLSARRVDYDSQSDPLDIMEGDFLDSLDFNPFGPKRARKREVTNRRHNDSTLQIYGERFASRVLAASRRLHELGVNNATVARLGKYPTTIADIEAITSELEAASASIPSLPWDVSALHQANTFLKNEVAELRAVSAQRHLGDDKQRAVAQVVRTGLRDLWELHRTSPSWTEDDKEERIFIHLYTMENDRETILYRADFAKAFEAGGLGVRLGEFVGTSGDPKNEQFVGTVSLVATPQNLVRPFVLHALRSADISVNECDGWPISQTTFDNSRGSNSSAATLIIGQRR